MVLTEPIWGLRYYYCFVYRGAELISIMVEFGDSYKCIIYMYVCMTV